MFTFLRQVFAVNGGSWVEQSDGTLTRFEVGEAGKDFARFVKKLNDEGLINKDFISLPADPTEGLFSDEFAAENVGIVQACIPEMFATKLLDANPNAKFAFMPPVEGPNGTPANLGHSEGYWWSTIVPKTSKNPDRVMDLLEYALTEEGRELTLFGIKGIHFSDYTEEGKLRVYAINKDECDADWDTNTNGYIYPLSWGGFNYYEHAYIPISEHNNNFDEAFKNVRTWLADDQAGGFFGDWQGLVAQYCIPSPLLNCRDERLYENSAARYSIYSEGLLKAIFAKDDAEFEAEWNAMVSQWMAAGGAEIIAIGNEIYKDRG